MKSLIIAIGMLLSVSAFATSNVESKSTTQVIYPRLTVWTNSVQLDIWNHTNRDARCSGWIYTRSAQGKMDQRYYNGIVYRGMRDFRNIYTVLRAGDRLVNAHHSIYCTLY